MPIKNYSSGMYMRLGFAIAANLDPDILLLDEIFAVGDADFQQRCIATVKRFMAEGKTIIFVSHAPAAIRAICRRVCVLEQGELAFDGDVESGLAFYEQVLAQRAEDREHCGVRGGARPGARSTKRIWIARRTGSPSGGHWAETGHWQFELLRRRGSSRATTSSTSAAAAWPPPSTCCRFWTSTTTGASRRTPRWSTPG